MDITLFNWDEIYKKSRKDLAAIIILAFAQTKLYNESSSQTLLKKLNINHIPQFLFANDILRQTKTGIVCNYRTIEPISYFNNPNFLLTNINARHKVNYLRAISMRRLSSKENKIPRDYFDTINYNPLLKVDDDFIYFTFES